MAKKKRKKTPKKNGRPSKLNKIDLGVVYRLAAQSLTEEQIAKVLDISVPTLNKYKKRPDFLKALKEGKVDPDRQVELSLFKRANGFQYTETTYEAIKIGKTKTPGLKVKEVVKLVVPDVLAQIFWLKNRKPEEWRDRQEVGLNVKGNVKLINQVPSHSNKKKK